ncbi:MAG: hypothetical protein ACI976_001669, partial [Aureispira sp.]
MCILVHLNIDTIMMQEAKNSQAVYFKSLTIEG